MVLNMAETDPPRPVTATMMTTAMSDASKAYSMAVAPWALRLKTRNRAPERCLVVLDVGICIPAFSGERMKRSVSAIGPLWIVTIVTVAGAVHFSRYR